MPRRSSLHGTAPEDTYLRQRERIRELEAATNTLAFQTAELEVLRAIDVSILGRVPFGTTFATAADAVAALLCADKVDILRFIPDRGVLSPFGPIEPADGQAREWPVRPGSLTGEAIASHRPCAGPIEPAGDASLTELWGEGFRSLLTVPVTDGPDVVAVMNVLWCGVTLPSSDDVDRAVRIARRTAVVVRAAEVAESEGRRTAQLEAIQQMNEAIERPVELGDVLDAALESAVRTTGVDAATVYLLYGEELRLVAERNLPEPFVRACRRVKVAGSLVGRAIQEARPQLIQDVAAEPGFGFRTELAEAGLTEACMVEAPLVWDDQVIGVLTLATFRANAHDEEDLELVELLARPLAAAIGKARLHSDLRRVHSVRRRLVSRLVTAQESERHAIASDIHDDSIQVMTAVGMRLEMLQRRITDPDHLELIEGLDETVRHAIERLRHLLFQCRPAALDREGLGAAMRILLKQLKDEAGLEYQLQDDLREETLPEARTILYRIAQEALSNVRKHAGAGGVNVRLSGSGGGVLVRIEDQGPGFDAGNLTESPEGHLGLTAMRERAELAGGWWRVESAPGSGTIVEFWVPHHLVEGEPWNETKTASAS